MLEKLLVITRGFIHRFPEGKDPFQIMTRLFEEGGELAEQVSVTSVYYSFSPVRYRANIKDRYRSKFRFANDR